MGFDNISTFHFILQLYNHNTIKPYSIYWLTLLSIWIFQLLTLYIGQRKKYSNSLSKNFQNMVLEAQLFSSSFVFFYTVFSLDITNCVLPQSTLSKATGWESCWIDGERRSRNIFLLQMYSPNYFLLLYLNY